MVGNWYDYRNPKADNQNLLSKAVESGDLPNFFEETFSYSGTYIVFVLIGNNLSIFSDLHALNSLFYQYEGKNFSAASDPALFKLITELNFTENKSYQETINTSQGKIWGCCPGTDTGFRNLYRLLPNYYLDVERRIQKRFFPKVPFESQTLQQAVPKIAEILSGYLKAASHRKPLALALTAGWDSRLLFAASLELDDVYYYTLYHPYSDIEDTKTAEELCALVDKTHHQLSNQEKNNSLELERVIDESVFKPIKSDICLMQNFYHHRLDKYLDICGITGEGLRGLHNRGLNINKVRTAAGMLGFKESLYLREELRNWFIKNKQFCLTHGINYLDLIYSEMYYSVVKAKNYRTFAHCVDTFTPYNSRELYAVCSGVPAKAKYPYDSTLMKEVIKSFDPDLLSIPFNRHKSKAIKLLVKTRLYYPAMVIKDFTS
jgi:hypothetical protein